MMVNTITIRRLNGSAAIVNYDSEMMVAQLKVLAGEQWHLPPDQFMILFNHKYLHDNRSLSTCGISAGDTLYSILKLASGMPIDITLPDMQVLHVRIVPYQLVGDILRQLGLSPTMYCLHSRIRADHDKQSCHIIDNDEFCGDVVDDLRTGTMPWPRS